MITTKSIKTHIPNNAKERCETLKQKIPPFYTKDSDGLSAILSAILVMKISK